MFKTFTGFCIFFKFLVLLILWIHDFCDFMSYLVFWLQSGCTDFGAVTQRLLEHSSINLTNKVYTNVDPVLRHAVEQLLVGEWL